ncbi:MAG: TlpA disulfide reductase family protein [Isosphaeraceae bacterium]|nr:TlpA disulfide reductase family protein [Isosphaeraceae bacterium]
MRLRPPTFRTRLPLALGLAAVGCLALAVSADEAAPRPQSAAMLHLTNGGFVAGALLESGRPGHIRWQPTGFTAPLDFFASHVNAIHIPSPTDPPKAQGDTCLELAGGDVLSGTLLHLNDREATLDVAGLGAVVISRTHVRTLTRLSDAGGVVFVGPSGLSGWRAPQPDNGWSEESGQLTSRSDGAVLRSRFNLPARAIVEFELSWKRKPDFVLALGVDDTPASLEQAFRFEIYENDFVVRCVTEHEADFASLGTVASGDGRGKFRVYLDQARGRVVVRSSSGKTLADMMLKEKSGQALPGLALINNRGESQLRLERLKVLRWTSDLPHDSEPGLTRVVRTDGTATTGELVRLDDATHEFVVRDHDAETRIPAQQLASATLSAPQEDAPRDFCVVGQDGTRLSGELLGVGKNELSLAVPGITGPLRFPLTALRSLLVLRHVPNAVEDKDGKKGTLVFDGARLPGLLTNGVAAGMSSCLTWQPDGSEIASPLRTGISGRIVYRVRAEPAKRPVPQAPGNQVMILRMETRARPLVRAPEPSLPLSLHLLTGDVIPGEVTKIDEKGVWFQSAITQGKFVPHEKIKAVELARLDVPPIRVTKSKRERLLTLPRMQKESPPTHMVQSRNGDYLRGRVLKLDDGTLQVEVHLETKDIPRNRVARIIWLHAQEGSPDKDTPPKPAAESDARGTRVQAVRNDGIRLTYQAVRFADGSLSGTSDVLGPCDVPLKDVDELLLGSAIEREASQLDYQRWKLQDAPEPKYVQADSNGSAGTESDLVGKPAPDFTLDLLDGKAFHLADGKGKVIVLDFWATWCGPCLQAMPQVERAAKEFPEKDVQLIAVNLEEAPKKIQAMLERQKLAVTVALDRDGVVARKYKANAIPQTVVIDREGNIARLFVGSSPHLGDQLRDAIQNAVAGGASKEKK